MVAQVRASVGTPMSAVFEYSLLILVGTCVFREAFLACAETATWQIDFTNLMRGHEAWLEHLRTAREQGLLGSPRLEERNGQLCVVGLGRCQPVQSVAEGMKLIDTIATQAMQVITPPAAPPVVEAATT